jgi:3-oxoacyl-(acyl-carrier-protein) synthase
VAAELASLPRRVVLTGASVATARGCDLDTFWTNLGAGACGISRVPHVPDDSPLPVKHAGCIPDDLLRAATDRFGLDDPDRANQLALFAVGAALEHAGWPTDGQTELPHDLILGTGIDDLAIYAGDVLVDMVTWDDGATMPPSLPSRASIVS